MTPDGISDAHWQPIEELALAIVASSEDRNARARLTSQLLEALRRLRAIYGDRASILAIEAHYVEQPEESETLLLRAFRVARLNGDRYNQRCVALSLAELYLDEFFECPAAAQWLATSRDLVRDGSAEDRERYEELTAVWREKCLSGGEEGQEPG